MTITLKDTTTLTAARTGTSYEYELNVYDDCDGSLWLYGHEYGPTMVIRARSFECAYGIAIDESDTIDESELPEAYGFYGDNAQAEFDKAVDTATEAEDNYPELVEGYRMQDNCSGTGIVETGHYEWLRKMTREDCATVRLTIRADD